MIIFISVIIVTDKDRISIITNIPTPYRRKQWEYFSKQDNLNLTIYYSAVSEHDRFWTYQNASNVEEKFMRGFSFHQFHFNPIILKVIRDDCDLFIMGSYGYPTVMLAILLLKLFKKPWVLIHDGVSPLKLDKEKSYIKLTKKVFMTGANAYYANGTVSKRDLKNYQISGEKIFNQYLTVDVQDFISKGVRKDEFRKEIRSEHDIDNDSVVLMYSGRLIKSKGVQNLIDAARKLLNQGFNVYVLIVGEGSYRKTLESYCEGIESRVVFTGHVKSEEIHKYYYASDIFILPSYDDPWGLVVNEAMACGLPIIVSDATGCSIDLVKNNGYVFPFGNVDRLYEKLVRLMDSKLRKKYSEKSYELINNWTYRDSLNSFNHLLKFIKQ